MNNNITPFCTMLSDIPHNIAFFGGPRASTACSSDKSSSNFKMSMENRWNDRGNKSKVLGEKLA
jgi:hypothetical protein